MSDVIIAAIITGVFSIIGNLIIAYKRGNNNRGKSILTNKKLNILFLIFGIFIIVFTGLVLKSNYYDRINKWTNYWITYEDWNSRESIGALTIKENSKIGVFYNENLEKIDLDIKNQGNELSGKWKNNYTKKIGTFQFIQADNFKFMGNYKIGKIEKYWNGENFDKYYTHILTISTSPNNKIGFRSKPLKKDEFQKLNTGNKSINRNTLIGEIENGSRIKFIKENKETYKIIAICKNELRVGYIAKTFNGNNTIRNK